MDKSSFTIFHLTEDQAIAILETPSDQLEDASDRYIAASRLVNFPSDRSINALIAAIQNNEPGLNNRIVRRKAVETLGYFKASVALPIIRACLGDEDTYTIENAVWAIGEIGTQDESILEEIAQLLEKPKLNYRAIIHTLAKLEYKPALERIRKFTTSEDQPISSAAIATVCRFTGDYTQMSRVVDLLQHSSVNARRSCIQDLIDAKYYPAIPEIVKCCVSTVFRLRGIRSLAQVGIPSGKITFADVEPHLEKAVWDHPDDLEFVHEYDQTPSLEFAINELYETDFGRCYLATKTLLDVYPDVAPAALMANYAEKAYHDYGAHYHVIKLLGWFKYQPAYDLLVEALYNQEPQFKKSRTGAAIALGELGDKRAIPVLQANLEEANIWHLKYACLMALDKFRVKWAMPTLHSLGAKDSDFLVQAKAALLE
ncbi:HEAT repeat domain-containing protein [Calothrix rhizosoleniae]|uniref:HEAT repeat domain-containing protein n=1 Tax=Calothrix rhizosoleniae TaxID=888997 RepID=UPI000B4A2D18|nr:HEAT repeat domain-containing protein [Calothrix rhizosoleniae]